MSTISEANKRRVTKAPRYVLIGWKPDAMSWSIYHWDYVYESALSQLEYHKRQSPGVEFSILVNVTHYKSFEKRDELMELINALTTT